METNLEWDVLDDMPAAESGIVESGLSVSNHASAPLRDVRGLSVFARRPAGDVVGGAVGRTWGACCELRILWVDESLRKQGIGAGLVRRFEERARQRGCTVFYLETYSFQAPRFYRELGYVAEHEIDGYPDGIVKYTMVRRFANGEADPGGDVR